MKTYLLILLILVVSIIVILRLITSSEPVTSPEISLDTKSYDTGKSTYQYNDETYYKQRMNEEIDDRKLMAFAKAFVQVQSYMNRVGSRANYKKTSRIVQGHGLSVEDYTKIASRMNKNADFQNKVRKMINEAN